MMKRLLIITLAVASLSACQQNAADQVEEKAPVAVATTDSATSTTGTTAAPAVLTADAPKFKFDKEIFDFKVIQEGEKVQTSFTFKNVGKTPLIIADASATCGCTVPEYPKIPIKPGEEGVISVVFNSQGKVGMQDKVVTITSNADPQSVKLHVVGEVKAKN